MEGKFQVKLQNMIGEELLTILSVIFQQCYMRLTLIHMNRYYFGKGMVEIYVEPIEF